MAQSANTTPQSFEDIETLVKQLYQPGSAKQVSRIQAKLHQWQRSDAGWDVAERLLSNDDANVRFFGALTLTIKLNVDWRKIGSDQEPSGETLLSGLVTCLIQFVNPINRHEPPFVIKKLCSTLVTFFCKPILNWSLCIRQLACSLYEGRYVEESMVSGLGNFMEIISHLTALQLQCVLWFATDLADEIGKLDGIESRKIHNHMRDNAEDVSWLIQCGLRFGTPMESTADMSTTGQLSDAAYRVVQTSLSSFVSWSYYCQREWMFDPELVQTIVDVIPLALTAIYVGVDDAENIFVDWLDSSGPILRSRSAQNVKEHFYVLFTSSWCEKNVASMREGDPSSVVFSRLLIAFAEIEIDRLTQETDTRLSRSLLDLLHMLLQCPGTPGDDDEYAPLGLEFWGQYIESVNEQMYQSDSGAPPWLQSAMREARQALHELFVKLNFPPSRITSTWSSDTRQSFSSFRTDFQDILQSAYTFLGSELTDSLTQTANHQLATKDWMSVEASLFCLNALADSISETLVTGSPEDENLLSLFKSSLFSELSADASIPGRVRRTAVELLGQYSPIFERRVELLPSALNFLFSSLTVANLAIETARSISKLCSSCRSHLTAELPAFVQHYASFCSSSTADVLTREKVMEGIASVVQALSNVQDQVDWVSRLLNFIEDDIRGMLEHVAANRIEEGQVKAYTAMACLASLGKGMQAPDDAHIGAVIDQHLNLVWHPVHERILSCINTTTQVLENDPEVIEQACQVLRAGYKEKLPGPFVLPADATTKFIERTTLQTPRLPIIMSTASIFVKSHVDHANPQFKDAALRMLTHIVKLMWQLDQPSEDPEVAQTCIEVLSNYISGDFASVLVEYGVALRMGVEFTLRALQGSDVLPKRAAALFWTTIITASAEGRPRMQSIAKEATTHFGPRLCDVLVEQICGGAPKSALEYLSVPFTKLIQVEPDSRLWIERSLEKVVSDPSGDMRNAKMKFMRSIMGARGATARKIISEIWTACRQHAISNTSTGSLTNPQLIE
ncbi:ARM repeat-containing protein [Pseudovirgaria hyperparasitica]|uniref:ARM repeat-containing protein n=1 Tax=Pseudovirgaria hyperparasitica TaxID=470096 RepID=A0A6A6W214_9PEZI|nr:ARM repeat-containing protein [Pseudovirgaria hyperparasitica]KAF2756159.1 ARM repeat-containing protein [Pseudovirgaria hyperparasitica]